ncbi:hypothetical protein NMY22_g11443 [Coprinellus aureogranulatus]|nr:hypothetical protein NMY22_g11443 [Coprinellus aureogranulatus]
MPGQPLVGVGGTTAGMMPPAPTVPRSSEEHLEHDAHAGSNGIMRSDEQHMRAMAMGHVAHPVNGYFSYKSKVFLADVYDHMDFALSSLDMFAGTTENLINYAFNIASYDMNIVMNRLTLVTIIFLPLTLLTGYFGMNFTPFWSVEHNSDAFFWKLAAPIMAVLIPLFMLSDIKQAWKSWRRRRDDYRAVKSINPSECVVTTASKS